LRTAASVRESWVSPEGKSDLSMKFRSAQGTPVAVTHRAARSFAASWHRFCSAAGGVFTRFQIASFATLCAPRHSPMVLY
jgi:hypothetical protein